MRRLKLSKTTLTYHGENCESGGGGGGISAGYGYEVCGAAAIDE